MAMTVQRRKEDKLPRYFQHKVADVRGGVSVKVTGLGGDYLHEGAVLTAPTNGICQVVKVAELAASVAATDKEIKVKKNHNFAVGDRVGLLGGESKAYKISSIDYTTSKDYDIIKVSTALALGVDAGGFLIETDDAADVSTAKTLSPKLTAFALAGTGRRIEAGQNLDTDAVLIGVTQNRPLPTAISTNLKGIINY